MRLSSTFLAFVLASPVSSALAQSEENRVPVWPSKLQDEVTAMYQAGFSGQIHLFVKDLKTQVQYTHNASTPTYIASVVKIAFMVELFDQIERGELSMDDYVEFTKQDVRSGSPLFNYLPVGARLPIRVLLEAMIQQSDNTASDLIANKLGLDRINRGLKARGYNEFGQVTRLLDVRKLVYGQLDPRILNFSAKTFRSVDFAKGGKAKAKRLCDLLNERPGYISAGKIDNAYRAYYRKGYNGATMANVGRLLEDLYRGDVVSSTASIAMIDVLKGTQTGRSRISAYLPPDTQIAHKTGTQYRRTCDVGLIYLPSQTAVVFAACIKGSKGVKRDEVIARLAHKTYELFTKPELVAEEDARHSKKRKKRRKRRGRKKRQSL